MFGDQDRFHELVLCIREFFHKGGIPNDPDSPVPLDAVLDAVSRMTVFGQVYPIKVSVASWDPRSIFALLLRYDGAAEIRVSNRLNRCWTRFSVAKELCHLLVDDLIEYRTADPVELAMDLISGRRTTMPGISETRAEYGAIELLLPWHTRPEIAKMVSDGASTYQIAYRYRVPEKYVSVLTDSDYWAESEQANALYRPDLVRPGNQPAIGA